jgi:hypothetical protein
LLRACCARQKDEADCTDADIIIGTTAAAQPKSESRVTAENSVIGAFSLVIAVAVAHFVPGDSSKQAGPITDFQRLIIEVSGMDMVPIHPGLLFNFDDSTIAACTGEGVHGSDTYVKLLNVNVTDTGRVSPYSQEGKDQHNWVRMVKWACHSASGASAPVFIKLALTAEEMPVVGPNDSDVLIHKIPGMQAGAQKNPATAMDPSTAGTLCFVRVNPNAKVGDSASAKVGDIQQREYFHKLVDDTRAMMGMVPGTPPTMAWTAVVSGDGCGAQLAMVLKEDFLALELEKLIVRIKGHAGRTAVEQACDATKQFKEEKRLAKQWSPTGPFEKGLAARILNILKDDPRLNMKLSKMKVVAEFAAMQARIESASCDPGDIIRTFVALGYLDAKTQTHPVPEVLMATCRRPMQKAWVEAFWKAFPELYRAMRDNGIVPEEMWRKFVAESSVPADTTSDGTEQWRGDSITNESGNRHAVVGNTRLIAKRRELLEDRERAARLKEQATINQVDNIIAENSKAEESLTRCMQQRGAGAPGQPPPFSVATLEDFAKLKLDALQAFAHVRKFEGKRVKFTFPGKGKVAEAAAGKHCLILMAFELRASPVIIRPVQPRAAPAPVQRPRAIVVSHAATGNDRADSQPKASVNLANAEWCSLATRTVKFSTYVGVHEPDGDRADTVCPILAARLDEHLGRRVADSKKRESACWSFVRDNINRIVAVLEIGGCLVRDVEDVTPSDTLLRSQKSDGPFIRMRTEDASSTWEGAYLHFDTELGRWVRSGKVVGAGGTRTYGVRNNEHSSGARMISAKSQRNKFYMSYPHRDSAAAKPNGSCWEDLVCTVGMGFLRADADGIAALCDSTGAGLLHWAPDVLALLERLKMTSGATISMQEKKLQTVGYLFELVLDLLISPRHNVSESPGFESLIGVFGGTD